MTRTASKKLKTARPATAAMVARHAGVSVTTVSFALNGHGDRYNIPAETVERVRKAAEELAYVPNSLAKSLLSRSTKVIGVVFPHLRNDWAHRIMDGMYELLESRDYVPHIVNHRGEPDREAKELRSLAERRVDGILCNPLSGSAENYRRVIAQRIPLVFFGDTLQELPEVSYAAWDPEEVALTVRHMVDVGCRRIAYLGFDDNRLMTGERYDVFCRTLASAGLGCNEELFIRNQPGEPFDDALRAMFDPARATSRRPDGIFALYDDSAMAAVETLEEIGVRVPDDVCVATLGGSPMIGPRGYDLTATLAPVEAEGKAAVAALLRILDDPPEEAIHTRVGGGRLRIGRTTRREKA
ncbi:MAG: LacI family DNA-binding transcriptional regulator [Phycisphaerae bacterium]